MAKSNLGESLTFPIKTVIESVTAMIGHCAETVPFLIGAPGVGKSDACRQVGRNLDLPDDRVEFIHVNDYQVEDFTGIPDVFQGETVFRPTQMLRKFEKGTGPGLIVLEELAQASVHHQTWAAGIMHERRNNSFALDPEVSIMATGNRPQDRTGSKKVLPHLMDRMCLLEVDSHDIDSWAAWAMANGIRSDGVAFLRWRSELLNMYDPNADVSPTQRSWTKVFREIPDTLDDGAYLMLAAGFVGHGPAGEWVRTRDVVKTLPSLDEIRANPDTAMAPNEPSGMWAVTVALAASSDESKIAADFKYMKRLSDEYVMAFVSDVQEASPSVVNTQEFIDFCQKHSDMLVGTAEED